MPPTLVEGLSHYVTTHLHTDGPIPGPHSLLTLTSSAYRAGGVPIGTFTALPPSEDYELQCRFTPYTSMVNVMGLPAVSVPVLRDEGGLSWSVQLIGREGTEVQLHMPRVTVGS